MKAVILAAGRGRRLNDVSDGRPKCLLEIGGKPLIQHQIEALADNGVHEILVVTGYKADFVRAVVGSQVEYVHNDRYEDTNSLYSLWLTREWVKGSFVLMNSDLLFDPEILNRLLGETGNALAFDSSSSRGLEQTKVAISRGRVVDLGKDVPAVNARGESLGLLRFDDRGAKILFQRVCHLIEVEREYDSWVIEAVRAACSEVEIKPINVAGLPWVEIDYPVDLERARKEVWPAISRKGVVRRKGGLWVVAGGGGVVVAVFMMWLWRAYLGVPSVRTWEILAPVEKEIEAVKITFVDKSKSQKWWLCRKGGRPFEVEVEGPDKVRVDLRLLLPPGTKMPGRYVVEIAVDGKARDWRAFKATPRRHISFRNYVVADRDTVDVSIPEGRHVVQIRLLAGMGDSLLVRMRRPEMEEDDSEVEEE